MSGNEGVSETPHEQVEAYLVLQERLGVTEEVARDLTTVVVGCPEPGVASRAMTLGDFIATPHGSEKIDGVITQTKEALDLGADMEKAIRFGLGATAVQLDESGRLVRLSHSTEDEKKN